MTTGRSEETVWNEDDEKSLLSELGQLANEIMEVSALVKLAKSPNFAKMGKADAMYADLAKRTTSTPFAPRAPPDLGQHEV